MITFIKKKWKLCLGVAVIGIVVIVLAVSLLLGTIIKTAAVALVPKATGTEFKLDSVYFNIFTGNVTISGCVVGNPEGYDTPSAFELGYFNVDVSIPSLISDKLVIQNIEVHDMKVTYEQALTTNNISTIKANVDKFADGDKEKPEAAPEKSEENAGGESKKLQVDNILIEGTQVSVSTKGLSGAAASVTVPKIHITNLGTGEDGITLEALLMKVMDAVSEGVTTAVTSIDTDAAVDAVKDTSDKLINKVKGLLD